MAIAVVANTPLEEAELVDAAVAWLRDRLPPTWAVDKSNRTISGSTLSEPQTITDAAIDLRSPGGTFTTLAVEPRRSFEPRDVERLLPTLTRLLRSLAGDIPVLVVAPWLSPRTRELLSDEGINFIDITGNALLRVDNPAVYVQSTGATRNPAPAPRGRAGVRGPKAARLVRLLVDVRPPYGVREIAASVDLAPGYVSRLLDALDEEALVERSPRGQVVSVDVPGLLRRWTESYDVLKTNEARTFLAPSGAADAVARIAEIREAGRVAITGSFAAVRLAPVAAPALLLAYCDQEETIIDALDLLPADQGGNLVLLRPFDSVIWERTSEEQGVMYVAPSQIVADCRTGTGRMPSEAEAVLEWMLQNEAQWRLGSLDELARTETMA